MTLPLLLPIYPKRPLIRELTGFSVTAVIVLLVII